MFWDSRERDGPASTAEIPRADSSGSTSGRSGERPREATQQERMGELTFGFQRVPVFVDQARLGGQLRAVDEGHQARTDHQQRQSFNDGGVVTDQGRIMTCP